MQKKWNRYKYVAEISRLQGRKKTREINISSTKKTLSNACNCNLLKSKEEIAVRTVKIV